MRRSLLILIFLVFFSETGEAQICIDHRTLAAAASLFTTQKKTPKDSFQPPRKPHAQPRIEAETTVYLGDGIYAPKNDEPPQPKDQDRYLAARQGLRQQITQQREAKKRRIANTTKAPSRSRTTRTQSPASSPQRSATKPRKPPSQSLAQTLASQLGSAGCSGICF